MTNPFSVWLLAIRPKTLPLSCSAIILGTALAYYQGNFDLLIFILALVTAILLQVISNLANDFGDLKHGADNAQRVGPLRVMNAGLVSESAMKKALFIAIGLAIASGISLLVQAFANQLWLIITFIVLGSLAIVAAITYTMGDKPYGYRGLGDISVFLFFGLVGVIGSFTLYQGEFYGLLMLPASSCGLLSCSVLNINNIRDMKTDLAAGKVTLAARLGYKGARAYHWCLLGLAELFIIVFILLANMPITTWLHLLALPVLIVSTNRLKNVDDATIMNNQLKNTAIATFVFCSLFSIGLVL
ncbi:1,4-dihydroxy-2-naphthoate octaprenyltransferase [Thalassotalea aquiviva]|uniref:1,4-dihydroxy-2-naphthoate octaprenyltransferase n=1 Tax=Thalassotalea aquiviva TaxID=3242415 RepID=UPI00352A8D28